MPRPRPRRRRTSFAASTATLLAVVMLWFLVPSAQAAEPVTGRSSVVSQQGGTLRLGVELRALRRTRVAAATVCVDDVAGRRFDLPTRKNIWVTRSGVGWVSTATLDPGTYRLWACVRRGSTWSVIGARRSVVIQAPPSASTMPVDVPLGWRRVFADDFSTDLRAGGFPGNYGSRWASYDGFPNTSRNGDYDKSIISVHDGVMDLHLGARDGRPKVAAPVPLIGGRWTGQVYGRYSVRMRADPVAGYGVAFLLWSDRNVWDDGEINFPESGLESTAYGFNHCPGDPERNCHAFDSGSGYDAWHTYTIEWTPERLSYLLDGVLVSSTTTHIPTRSLHWVMQVETPQKEAAVKNSAHLQIDWATIDALS